MAKRAQIKGTPEDVSAKLKRWLKTEYYDEEKFSSNLVSPQWALNLLSLIDAWWCCLNTARNFSMVWILCGWCNEVYLPKQTVHSRLFDTNTRALPLASEVTSLGQTHAHIMQGVAKAVGLFFGSTLVFAYFGEAFNV